MAGGGVGVVGVSVVVGLLLDEEVVVVFDRGGGVGDVEGIGVDELELGVLDEIGQGISTDA